MWVTFVWPKLWALGAVWAGTAGKENCARGRGVSVRRLVLKPPQFSVCKADWASDLQQSSFSNLSYPSKPEKFVTRTPTSNMRHNLLF